MRPVRRVAKRPSEPPLVPVSRDTPLPLSFAQESFWTLEQLLPGMPFFSTPTSVHLVGALNREAFRRSIHEIVARHEVLRTSFELSAGRPCQVVHGMRDFQLPVIDLSALPAAQREHEMQRLAREEAYRPFELSRSPLMRIETVVLGAEEHAVLFTTHHIIADAWTSGVFLAELSTLYRAFVSGARYTLPRLLVQYADYASWQRQASALGCFDHQLAYWRQRLEGPLSPLSLSASESRRDYLDVRSALTGVTFATALLDGLRARIRGEGISLFTILIAALCIVIQRRTGRTDIRIATLVANRARPELEHLLGLLVNTVILRTHVSSDSSRAQVLRQVREAVVGAVDNQDVPFDRVVEELEADWAFDRAGLAPVLFLMQNAGLERLDLPGLRVGALRGEVECPFSLTTFEWIVTAKEQADGLTVSLRYKPQLFPESEIVGVLEDLANELNQWATEPRETT
jgi:hypothetical protein